MILQTLNLKVCMTIQLVTLAMKFSIITYSYVYTVQCRGGSRKAIKSEGSQRLNRITLYDKNLIPVKKL